ncbi:MAG: GNAT family N-acetyltransferase [Defluviitaleaceae bacterium]|nr:GNAT family N-acetyltransferase [Defluviitaleaceae bacterium]
MIELVFPTLTHKHDALEYRKEHADNGENVINGSAGFVHADSYESWLKKVIMEQSDAPPGFVPSTTFFAMDGDRIVGMISIRHYLNDELLRSGGNIGYGVRPSERRKGYGPKMLALALKKCPSLGLEKALITCDKSNTASAKTITKNGGVLENEIEENGSILQRYWVPLAPPAHNCYTTN